MNVHDAPHRRLGVVTSEIRYAHRSCAVTVSLSMSDLEIVHTVHVEHIGSANTARSRCRWSVSGGRACGTVCVYHEPVDGASERLAGASDCSAARVSAAVADQNVLQPVVWQQADGHAQLAAGVIETELAAGEGVLGLVRANRPRRHLAARRGVTNMMLLQHPFIWWLSQWDGAAALPS